MLRLNLPHKGKRMADIDQLLSTILAKQEPRQQQFREGLAEEERRKKIGTIRQGSFYDDNIAPLVNMIKPEQFSNQANVDPETGAPIKDMGHFLTSGFSNTAANALSSADALSMLLLGGAGAAGGKKFLKGLGETGGVRTGELQELIERMMQRTEIKEVGVEPARRDPDMISRGLGITEKDPLDSLLNFKRQMTNHDELTLRTQQDMAGLVDPYLPKRDKIEMAKRLKLRPELANNTLNQMSAEDQRQVRRALKKLGY